MAVPSHAMGPEGKDDDSAPAKPPQDQETVPGP